MAKAISNKIRKRALELLKKGMRSQAVAQMLALVKEWQSALFEDDDEGMKKVRFLVE